MNKCPVILSLLLIESRPIHGFVTDLSNCHDDFSLKPPDGVLKRNSFKWLGFVQYTHITTGLPHHSKAPRVVLIQRQFVVGTATDLLNLPKNYKLGNVVFGEYEQEEEECGLSRSQVKMGLQCPRAYMEIPLMEITPHPEYSRFGVGNSLALVKLLRPMRSNYMVPVCMPSLGERYKKKNKRVVFMIDYITNVPRDFETERMGKKSLKLYTHKECRKHRMKTKLGSEGVTHVLCTSGCGVRNGAPIISQNSDGAFELIGITAGSGPCARKSMRKRLIREPPLYIDLYPYVTWMINVISAHEMPTAYPRSYNLMEGGPEIGANKQFLRKRKFNSKWKGWRARTYVSGKACFSSIKKQRRATFFYSEKFEVNADPPARFTLYMKLSAGIQCTITCARLLLPNRLIKPIIEGVGGYNISIHFTSNWFPYTFYYGLSLTGKNSTFKDMYEWINERSPGFW